MDLTSIYAEIGKRYVEYRQGAEAGAIDFAAAKGKGKPKTGQTRKAKPNCKTGFPCGYACLNQSKTCKSALPGQAKTYFDWLKMQGKGGGVTTAPPASSVSATPAPASPAVGGSGAGSATATPPTQAQPQKTVKLNDAELSKQRSALVSAHGQKLIDDAEANVQKLLDDADIFIRVGSAHTLAAILGDRFKTSAELGIQSHSIPYLKDKNYQNARNRVEAKNLGYDLNTKPEERPIYGYIGTTSGKNLDGQSHSDVAEDYGSISVQLKREVKDRASFTGSDSFKSGAASKLDEVNAASLIASTRHGYDRDKLPKHYPSYYADKSNDGPILAAAARAKSIDDLVPILTQTGNAYMEAQIHGGVRPQDIAAIHFTRNSGAGNRPGKDIAQFAKDNGVDLYVEGKKLSKQEIDDIITPPSTNKVKDLRSAMDSDDFTQISRISKDLIDRADTIQMNPGENDKQIKALYEAAGYDNVPRVGTAQDVTDTWQKGGLLMVRGDTPDPDDRTKFLRQFQTGDYHIGGSGGAMYGSGTYVGHAGSIDRKNGTFTAYSPATNSSDALRAVKDVARHGYITKSSVVTRMAMDSSANVILQSKLLEERNEFVKKFDAWQAQEEAQIKAANPPDPNFKLFQAAQKKAERSNSRLFGKTAVATVSRLKSLPTGEQYKTHTLTASSGETIRFDVFEKIQGANKVHYYYDENGRRQSAGNLKQAVDQSRAIAVKTRSRDEALKSLKLARVPSAEAPAVTSFRMQAERTRSLLGIDDDDSGLGRFAVIRGYDAYILDQSYAADTFAVMLNRSKVLVQEDPVPPGRWSKVGAA